VPPRTARRLTPDQWREAEALAVEGVRWEEIAPRFGVTVATLRRRARVEDWQTPGRVAWKARGQGAARRPAETVAQAGGGTALARLQEALLAAGQARPEDFRQALTQLFQAVLAESAPNIPLPRTLGEWTKLHDAWHKASGAGQKRPPEHRLFRPLRSVPRTVVDVKEAEDDPLEGFEV